MASNNMYRVGDFVYFESSATAPFQIRRIDELNKTSTGAVEAKVVCFYRRRDVSSALINLAEKYYNDSDDDDSTDGSISNGQNNNNNNRCGGGEHDGDRKNGNFKTTTDDVDSNTDCQKHQIKHRELFYSRQVECLPATHIRGKCSVTLYNEVEPLANYLAREDAFYYKLIYDPSQKTLQEDRGTMRIGSDHQSDIDPRLKDHSTDPRLSESHEELLWQPNSLTDQEVDMFCLLTRAVGTLGRAHDNSSASRQPLLLGAASSAGRDITRQHAHDLLHRASYDLKKAMSLLLPGGQPVLCRDQLEEWSASEAHLFEEALDKHSKVFPEIKSDYLPWKTHKSIVELYYLWKTTDRYVRRRRTKVAAEEHKLKQVYIPNYNKPNPSVLFNGSDKTSRGCEGCAATFAQQWYSWGPPTLFHRICPNCWSYWKRYGGLKNETSKGAPSGRPDPEQRALDRAAAALRASSNTSTGTNSSYPDQLDCRTTDDAPPMGSPATGVTYLNPTGLVPSVNSVQLGITGRYPDRAGLPVALAGNPRGTQYFRTPVFIRLARILCPRLIVPSRLARRPGKLTSSSVLANRQSSEITAAVAESPTSDGVLTLNSLKIAAQPIIAQLADPTSILSRTRATPPSINDVICRLASRKGIKLQCLDLRKLLGSSKSNGPPNSSSGVKKRPYSSSPESTKNDDHLNGSDDALNGVLPKSNSSSSAIVADGPPCKKQVTVDNNASNIPPCDDLSPNNGLRLPMTDDITVTPEVTASTGTYLDKESC